MERLGFKGFGRGVRGEADAGLVSIGRRQRELYLIIIKSSVIIIKREADAGLVSIGRRQRELYLRVYAPICPRGIGIPSMLLVMRGVE